MILQSTNNFPYSWLACFVVWTLFTGERLMRMACMRFVCMRLRGLVYPRPNVGLHSQDGGVGVRGGETAACQQDNKASVLSFPSAASRGSKSSLWLTMENSTGAASSSAPWSKRESHLDKSGDAAAYHWHSFLTIPSRIIWTPHSKTLPFWFGPR